MLKIHYIKPRCNGGRRSTFAFNSALVPSGATDFAVAHSDILAGNSFSVRCHVTSKLPMRARAAGKNIFQLFNKFSYRLVTFVMV